MDATKVRTLDGVQVVDANAGEAPEVAPLVERAKTGDPDAFEDLMRLYERRVIALGIQMGLPREDALDACQDAFLKVFKYLHRFKTGEIFFRWLHRIALNVIFDHLRARRARHVPLQEVQESGEERLHSNARSPLEHLETERLSRRLHEALDCLGRRERMIFVLRDLHQISTDRIGMILEISPVTVRRHCMSARQKLRARLVKPPE